MFERIKTWLGGARSPASASTGEVPFNDAARVAFRRAVHHYPAHVAPHPGYARELTPEQAQANLDWFLASLPDRLQVLDALLAEFCVPAQPADGYRIGEKTVGKAVGIAGGLGDAWAGAAAGAALGSVVPGVGTVIGGIAGAILGGWRGEVALSATFDKVKNWF